MNQPDQKKLSPEEEKKILKETEDDPNAFSENLIIDEEGKPHSYRPGVAEKVEQGNGNQPGDPAER